MVSTNKSRRRVLRGLAAGGAVTATTVASTRPADALLRGLLGPKTLPGLTEPGGLLEVLGKNLDPVTSQLGITLNAPAPATPFDIDPAVLHRLRRWTYGPTPALKSSVRTGPQAAAYLEQQLNPSAIDDSACDAALAPFPSNRLTGKQVAARYGLVQRATGRSLPTGALLSESVAIKTVRAIHTDRQLLERMTEVWMDHFNVPGVGQLLVHRQHFENTAVRPNALGSFASLLTAATTHPAMLLYLDQWGSTKEHPTQNHPRELLELHTVGVASGYGEDDVIAASRLMTGLTIVDHGYRWDQARHDTGAVTILGRTWGPDTGEAAVQEFLQFLARHPATATRVATKLCQTFVSDAPSAQLVASAAEVYQRNDTQIAPVLRHIFASAEFAEAAGRKLLRPFEMLVATARAAQLVPSFVGFGTAEALVGGILPGAPGLVPDTDLAGFLATAAPKSPFAGLAGLGVDAGALLASARPGRDPVSALADLVMSSGQHPGGWGPPNGYPVVAGPYLAGSAFFRRLSTVMVAAGGASKQLLTNYPALLGFPASITQRELFVALFRALTHRPPTDSEIATLAPGIVPSQVVATRQIGPLAERWAPIVAALPENNLR
ncbi:MAG: DUF1800 domain-containing protein [Actinomycetota bacterium]|nr:DUF1800 domain-containing protein [Actinomycetota bacterium]